MMPELILLPKQAYTMTKENMATISNVRIELSCCAGRAGQRGINPPASAYFWVYLGVVQPSVTRTALIVSSTIRLTRLSTEHMVDTKNPA